jgi:hypothetical protein
MISLRGVADGEKGEGEFFSAFAARKSLTTNSDAEEVVGG